MAYVWEIAKSLELFTEIDESEKESVEAICQQALDEINTKLKPGVDLTDPRITSAATGIAFYNLCVKRSNKKGEADMSSFKAGDLSISFSEGSSPEKLSLAKEIRDKAMLDLTPLVADNGFFFGKVDIYDTNPA